MTGQTSHIDKMKDCIPGKTVAAMKQDTALGIAVSGESAVRRKSEGGSIDFRG